MKLGDFELDNIYQGDCLELMRGLPDKCVDLVLTDPPYGIGADGAASKNNGKWGWKFYGNTSWDKKRPHRIAFDEMRRIGRILVVWGGNYFSDYLPPSMGWLFWDKGQRDFSLADGELAWTSENRALRVIEVSRSKATSDGKYHPTQKSLDVMKYCVDKYSEPDKIILDPFAGSGTTLVAAKQLGRRFLGFELEPKYVAIAKERLKQEQLLF